MEGSAQKIPRELEKTTKEGEDQPALSEMKSIEEKIQLLSAWRASGELDGFSDSEKEVTVIEVAQILENTDGNEGFKLACQIFDLLVPSGRTDFSHKTFADYLVSILDTLGALGYPKAQAQILNILGQAVYDTDPRVNPAELFRIFARLKFSGKHDAVLGQSLSFLLDNPKLSEMIKQDILKTIETNETQAIFSLRLIEEIAEEQGSDADIGAPPKMIQEILKTVELDGRSALTKRIVIGISKRMKKNEKLWQRNARGYDLEGDETFLLEEDIAQTSFEDLDAFKPTGVTIEQIRRAEEAVFLFRLFRQDEVLDVVEKDFGFPVRNLTLREQIWFVNSLKNYSPEKEKIVMEFTKKFGLDGVRAFLSCEYGDKFREVVLSIGEKLPEESARQVFEQYGKLALLAQEKSDELIKEFVADGKEVKVSAAAVEQELLRRAKDFLVEISKAAEVSPDEVGKSLAQYETDMVIFAGIFRTAFKGEKEIDLEKVRGLKLESRGVAEIDSKDKDEMLKIFEANWREQKPESADFLLGQLREKLGSGDPDCRFYLLKKDGELVAFVRFDNIEDIDGRPAVYGKSFNIKKGLRDSALGEAVMINAIGTEAADKTIVIDVFPELQAGTSYVENFGFVITGVEEFPSDEEGKTETRFIMKRDDRAAKAYRHKKIKSEVFDLSEGVGKMIERVKTMSEQGFAGTKYFTDPENKKLRYIVFEPMADMEVLSEAA